jgi:hypothetical protein
MNAALPGAPSSRGEVAQLVEHATENRGVASSILALATISAASLHRHVPHCVRVRAPDRRYGLRGESSG